jgi:hypothetical protein
MPFHPTKLNRRGRAVQITAAAGILHELCASVFQKGKRLGQFQTLTQLLAQTISSLSRDMWSADPSCHSCPCRTTDTKLFFGGYKCLTNLAHQRNNFICWACRRHSDRAPRIASHGAEDVYVCHSNHLCVPVPHLSFTSGEEQL